MDNKQQQKTPSQIDLMKLEIQKKNQQIEELQVKIGKERDAAAKAEAERDELLGAGIAGQSGPMNTMTSVSTAGLRNLFMHMWNRKLQHLDKRFVYKWLNELTGMTAEQCSAQIRSWSEAK